MNPLDILKPAGGGGFSFLELFMTAHPVVKIVMLGLLAASVWAWAIIVEKVFAFRRARREADRFEQMFWSGQSLEELIAASRMAAPSRWPPCSWPPCASGSVRLKATSG